jgi:hypothetical protein
MNDRKNDYLLTTPEQPLFVKKSQHLYLLIKYDF